MIWIFNFPDIIYGMTDGGPANQTHIVTTWMINFTQQGNYGLGERDRTHRRRDPVRVLRVLPDGDAEGSDDHHGTTITETRRLTVPDLAKARDRSAGYAGGVVRVVVLGLWLVITLFPLYWIALTSFKSPGTITRSRSSTGRG